MSVATLAMPAAGRNGVRRVSVLGATGSIGQSTLDLIARNADAFEVVALTGYRNVERLAMEAKAHRAEVAVIAEEGLYAELRARLAGTGIEAAAGAEAVAEAASRPADWVMAAIVGAAGIVPTLQAVRQGRAVALANKECLVAAGVAFMAEVAASGATLLPVDSEHSAAAQSMTGAAKDSIERLCLTASGGPFRGWTCEAMDAVTPEQALKHPNWSMGPKITIDSATLMNKALELIEAHYLFGLGVDRLGVLIHPQSIVHCLVHYRDGSVLAQMSCPDMRTPIAYSLAWPHRMQAPTERLDLAKLGTLTFEPPDEARFPALRIAREVLTAGGPAATIMNAANEIAVEAFLGQTLPFTAVSRLVEAVLDRASRDFDTVSLESVDAVLAVDARSRALAKSLIADFN